MTLIVASTVSFTDATGLESTLKRQPIHKFNRRNNFSDLIGCIFSDANAMNV